jgi:hypothetical protein
MDSNISVIESQLDWLTGTAKDSHKRKVLASYANEQLAAQLASGNAIREFRFKGYTGYQAGAFSWGEREDSAIIRVSGGEAADAYVDVQDMLDNISRLDAAVTVRQQPFDPTLAASAYVAALCAPNREGKPLNYTVFLNSKGGSTLYVGRRASAFFARFYNKGVESGEDYYTDCWRYEVEYKAEAARALRQKLAQGNRSGEIVQGLVHEHFSERGVPPIFDTDGPGTRLKAYRRRPDLVSRLNWLSRSVRPTAQWVIAQAGKEAALEALGLDADAILIEGEELDDSTHRSD